jgi:hypothetical protein
LKKNIKLETLNYEPSNIIVANGGKLFQENEKKRIKESGARRQETEIKNNMLDQVVTVGKGWIGAIIVNDLYE